MVHDAPAGSVRFQGTAICRAFCVPARRLRVGLPAMRRRSVPLRAGERTSRRVSIAIIPSHAAYNPAMSFLEARNLSKTYRNAEVPVPVFDGLQLDVEQGEMLAVVGPPGIGQSTLLHLLGGLD